MSSIKSITRVQIVDERLYNLAVENDESFIAEGIVVHNCKSYIRANLKTSKNIPDITGLPPLSDAAKKSITLSEDK